MALSGVLGALAIVVMLAGEIIPIATFACPVLVMVMTVPVMQECGRRLGWVWYAAVCILSFLLTAANPEATLIYIFLGYYPLIRVYVERLKPMPVRLMAKLVWFNGSVAAAYGLMIFVLDMAEVAQEFADSALWMLVAMVLLANLCFFMVERVLKGFEVYYIVKLRKMLRFK